MSASACGGSRERQSERFVQKSCRDTRARRDSGPQKQIEKIFELL
jgi:hypothetical protein